MDLQQVRLIVKVAHMYHERGINQPAIAAQLRISQARVSRLLKLASEQGIVRTTVHVPPGVFTDIEEALEDRYKVSQVIVVDAAEASDADLHRALAPTAAAYLESAVPACEVIGISSWSETLLAAVETMRPVRNAATRYVVQVLGGVGRPGQQSYATRLTERLAEVCHARSVFLLGPGIVATRSARQTLLADPHFAEVVAFYGRLSMVLTGIGGLATPSRLLRDSASVVSAADRQALKARGAVGDICLRFFDQGGHLVSSPLDSRVIGIGYQELRRTPRTVAIAGGGRKFAAIRAALRGRWVDTLITDRRVAERILREP